MPFPSTNGCIQPLPAAIDHCHSDHCHSDLLMAECNLQHSTNQWCCMSACVLATNYVCSYRVFLVQISTFRRTITLFLLLVQLTGTNKDTEFLARLISGNILKCCTWISLKYYSIDFDTTSSMTWGCICLHAYKVNICKWLIFTWCLLVGKDIHRKVTVCEKPFLLSDTFLVIPCCLCSYLCCNQQNNILCHWFRRIEEAALLPISSMWSGPESGDWALYLSPLTWEEVTCSHISRKHHVFCTGWGTGRSNVTPLMIS